MKKEQFTPHYIRLTATKDTKGCWNWPHINKNTGYGLVYIEGKQVLAHRASFESHAYTVPNGLYILHHCDNPRCVNPKHLYPGTPKDNAQDMIKRDRPRAFMPGHKHGSCKRKSGVSDDHVWLIRNSTLPLKDLAFAIGVSMSCVSQIRNRRRKRYNP